MRHGIRRVGARLRKRCNLPLSRPDRWRGGLVRPIDELEAGGRDCDRAGSKTGQQHRIVPPRPQPHADARRPSLRLADRPGARRRRHRPRIAHPRSGPG